MNKKFKLTDKVTKESIRSPEFKRWLKVVLAVVCIFSLIFQFSSCVFQGLKVSAAAPGETVVIELVPSLPSSTLTDMDAVFECNGTTYYGISINSSAIVYYDSADLPTTVYSDLSWTSKSYRTITIDQIALQPMVWLTNNSIVVDSYNILGTWVLDDFLSYPGNSLYNIEFTSSDYFFTSIEFIEYDVDIPTYYGQFLQFNGTTTKNPYLFKKGVNRPGSVGWLDTNLKVITITGGPDINNLALKSWLILNGVLETPAPPPIVHDFTNEIRQFNDNLTFYNTTSASWYESFSFDFEVIGVGAADTLILERDVNNYYTMSYNYNIDGVTTLQDVYSFHYPTQSGGFIRDNYKLIRFITNPDNTDFQQWLLDNTTLVGTVDDAPTFDSIYETGFNVGYNAGYEQGFANSLIGDSLSGPINALSSITLIQIGDVEITLGGVVMTAIALCLVLAFLKLYAGG